jgi:hypothetical protein
MAEMEVAPKFATAVGGTDASPGFGEPECLVLGCPAGLEDRHSRRLAEQAERLLAGAPPPSML